MESAVLKKHPLAFVNCVRLLYAVSRDWPSQQRDAYDREVAGVSL